MNMSCVACTHDGHHAWVLRQLWGGTVQENNVRLRKMYGNAFEGAPTIKAMGREAEFERIANAGIYASTTISTLSLAGHTRMNFFNNAAFALTSSLPHWVGFEIESKLYFVFSLTYQVQESNTLKMLCQPGTER